MKVLTFAASLRKASLNKKFIRIANSVLAKQAGVEVDAAEYREFEMPIYDGDVEERDGIPPGGKELIRRVRAANAIVISTPEYNGGMPGTLKNALDWASREKEICFDGKPMLLIGASPGMYGAVRGLWHARIPFEAVGTFVYPEMFGIPRAHQAFNEKGEFTDPKNQARLDELIASYIQYVQKAF